MKVIRFNHRAPPGQAMGRPRFRAQRSLPPQLCLAPNPGGVDVHDLGM